jgi:hypothetical protein
MEPSIKTLFSKLDDQMRANLEAARILHHPGVKGSCTESCWIDYFNSYLPSRYYALSAFVIDHAGDKSEQIDVVIMDRQYSPFIFSHKGEYYVPAESVYAVFEVKQVMDKNLIKYSQEKIASVRKLIRTSAYYKTMNGPHKSDLSRIISGMLSYKSSWKKPFGDPMINALKAGSVFGQIDFLCALTSGSAEVIYDEEMSLISYEGNKCLTWFLYELLTRLQQFGNVPGIEYDKYLASLY